MENKDIVRQIEELKNEKNAIILALLYKSRSAGYS